MVLSNPANMVDVTGTQSSPQDTAPYHVITSQDTAPEVSFLPADNVALFSENNNSFTFLQNLTNNATPHFSDIVSEVESWSDNTSYATGALALAIGVLGIIFNIVVIFSITHNHQLRSHLSNLLICNLAVGSLVGCVIMLMVEVPVRLMSRRYVDNFEDATCNMFGFVTSVLRIGTVWSVVALSIDKYRSIDSPLRHSLIASTFKSVTYFFLIWIMASVLSSFPFLVGQKYIFQPAQGTCDFHYVGNPLYWYILVYLSLVYYIPALVVCFCHWRIFAIARSQSRRMAAMVHLVTLIHVPLLNGRIANQQLSPQGRKAIYTTSIFIGTFLFCYAPHALVSTVRIFVDAVEEQTILSVSSLLINSAFLVNIFIYGYRNRMVRDSFAKYIRRKLLERASMLHWKRQPPATSPRRRVQDIVRMDRHGPSRTNYRPELHVVRSQPNLNTVQVTPVLPRAISLDVELTHDGDNASPMTSSNGDEIQLSMEPIRKIFMTGDDSLEVIVEDQLLALSEKGEARADNNNENSPCVSDDVEMLELNELDAKTPMLSSSLPDKIAASPDTSSTRTIISNGTCPLPPISKLTFVQLRESVV